MSSGDGATEQRTAAAGAGGPVQLGSQYGAAAPNASASAAVDGLSLELPGVLKLVGGTASAAAKLVPGTQRQSSASTALNGLSLAGGLVQLDGIRWVASHRSGAAAEADAGFSVASFRVGGQTLPTADPGQLPAALAAANTALAPMGLALGLPEVTRTATGIGIGALRLSVSATPALRQAVGATLVAIQPLRTQLLTLVTPLQMSPDCGMAKALGFGYLLVDLATLVLGEQGAVDLDLGGAWAGTDATAYANPFDSGFGLLPPRTLAPPALPALPPSTVGPAAIMTPRGAPPGASGAALPRVALTPTSMSCRSTHPHGGGCTTGHGQLAAWIVICLVAVLAAADRLRSRLT